MLEANLKKKESTCLILLNVAFEQNTKIMLML